MRALLLATLLIKYLRKFSHTSVEFSKPSDCGALRTELMVLKGRMVTVGGSYIRKLVFFSSVLTFVWGKK